MAAGYKYGEGSPFCSPPRLEVQCLIDHGTRGTLFGEKAPLLWSTETVMASYLCGDLCVPAVFQSRFLNLLQK